MSSIKPSQATIARTMAYASKGKVAAVTANPGSQLAVFNARATNHTNGAINVGVLKRFAFSSLRAFAFLDSDADLTQEYVEIPINAEDGSIAADIFNEANDELVLQSKDFGGLFGITVGNVEANGVYTYEYWDGSDWQTLTTIEVPNFGATVGDKYVVFLAPSDWVKGGDDEIFDSAKYSIKIKSTTAPDNPIGVTAVWAGGFLDYWEGLADNTGGVVEFEVSKPLILDALEGLMPYFGTANAANQFTIAYSQTG